MSMTRFNNLAGYLIGSGVALGVTAAWHRDASRQVEDDIDGCFAANSHDP
jgi:hypothetical protein